MINVRILDHCEFCDGETYVFDDQDVNSHLETYDRYRPYEMWHSNGNRAKLLEVD